MGWWTVDWRTQTLLGGSMRIGSLVMWTSQEDDGSYGSLGVITDIGDKSITVQWLNGKEFSYSDNFMEMEIICE